MPDWSLPLEGECRCGKLRFRITEAPMLSSACHCRGCQKMTSSAFALTLTVPETGFDVLQGEPVVGGMHGPEIHHYHCDWCKSWAFTRQAAGMGFVNVRSVLLDHPAPAEPFVEVFTDEKLPWATTPAKHSFATMPASMEEWGPLIAEYQASA